MNIKFNCKNDECIEIELADTDFVENIWLPYYKNLLSNQSKIKVKYRIGFHGTSEFQPDDLEKIKKDIDNIKSIVPFPVCKELFTSHNSDDMHFNFNRLHRCYTSGIMSLTRDNYLNWNKNFVNPVKDLDEILPVIYIRSLEEKLKLIEYLDNLNTHIHNCEYQLETENGSNCIDLTKKLDTYEISIDLEHNFNPEKQKFIEVESKHASINSKFNVWVSKEICGKDIVQCYIDNDDPRNYDITPPTHMHVNIFVDPYNSRLKIINSDRFRKWLNLYDLNVMDIYGLFPLGRVVNIIHHNRNSDKLYIWQDNNITGEIV